MPTGTSENGASTRLTLMDRMDRKLRDLSFLSLEKTSDELLIFGEDVRRVGEDQVHQTLDEQEHGHLGQRAAELRRDEGPLHGHRRRYVNKRGVSGCVCVCVTREVSARLCYRR